jgi:hypothetical protein
MDCGRVSPGYASVVYASRQVLHYKHDFWCTHPESEVLARGADPRFARSRSMAPDENVHHWVQNIRDAMRHPDTPTAPAA